MFLMWFRNLLQCTVQLYLALWFKWCNDTDSCSSRRREILDLRYPCRFLLLPELHCKSTSVFPPVEALSSRLRGLPSRHPVSVLLCSSANGRHGHCHAAPSRHRYATRHSGWSRGAGEEQPGQIHAHRGRSKRQEFRLQVALRFEVDQRQATRESQVRLKCARDRRNAILRGLIHVVIMWLMWRAELQEKMLQFVKLGSDFIVMFLSFLWYCTREIFVAGCTYL